MENVTHSLIGIILGEGIARRARLGNGPARRAVLWTSLLASNLPDFDFLMRPFVGGGLGYLLHHRGYTHSIALSVPLALIAAGVGRLVARQSVPWKPLLAAGWLGVLMHIGADFWNDYGVHPFWPLSNRWFYGDVVFIIEPLLWMTMLPFVFHISRTVSARVVCAILVLGILGVMFFRQDVPVAVAVFSMLWACGAFAVYRSLARRPRAGVLSGLLGVLLILVIFSGFSAFARHRILDAMPAGERVLQLASSPAPGNPLCWRLIVTSVTESATRICGRRI
jgi:inner membrane protein